ncbi:MAG TPA: hypothetical protein VI006_24320, partial [Solirubrobacteraceae bacterium]
MRTNSVRILLSLAVGLLLGVAAPATASAATLYVAPSGSGSACSSSSPCSSWDVALDKAAPGDHVQMAAGTYPSQTLTRDSTNLAPVVFEPAEGVDRVTVGTLVLRADYVTVRGVDASYLLPCSGSGGSCNPSVKNAVTGVTVEDFRSRGGMYGHGLDHVTFRNGEMGPQTDGSDLVQIGMGFPSRDVTFDRMYFHDNYPLGDFAATPHTDCIQAFGIDHFTISNSRFERCTNDDFLASTDSGAQWSNLTLVNNWFGKVFRCDSGHCRTVNELQQGYLSVYIGSNLTQGNNRIEGNYFEQALHQHAQAWAGTSTTLIRGN